MLQPPASNRILLVSKDSRDDGRDGVEIDGVVGGEHDGDVVALEVGGVVDRL
jgi:hypothetical protein